MSIDTAKLEKLKSLLKLVDESISKTDFEKAWKACLEMILKIEKKNDDKFTKTLEDLQKKIEDSLNGSEDNFGSLKREILRTLVKLQKESSDNLKFLYDKVGRIENGKQGERGLDGKDGIQGNPGKDGVEITAEQVREKLENLVLDDRLDLDAIRGITVSKNPPINPKENDLWIQILN